MGAEVTTSINGVWAKLEGQVVDGQFPLHRFLGNSDRSAVFLTASAERTPSDVALKLVLLPLARVESQLARWHTAAALSHSSLMRLFDVGRCSVASVANLYAVMEYADQDLAQLLQHRPLTEEEVREMLVPMLSALAFLHERKMVLGRLKPSNVLVVGDQLKLASDAIRPVGEVDDVKALSAYDPPEARDGNCSTAGDVWALGVTICEALTRRQPLGLLGGAGSVVLPPDLPPAFREIVAWCLRRQPQDRPDVAEIDAWLSGQPVGDAGAEVRAQAAARVADAAGAAGAASQAPPSQPTATQATASGAPVAAAAVDVELTAGMDSAAPITTTASTAPAASKAGPAAPSPPAVPAASKPMPAAAPTAAPLPLSAAPAAQPKPASAAPTVPTAPVAVKAASAAPPPTPARSSATPPTAAPSPSAASVESKPAPAASKPAPPASSAAPAAPMPSTAASPPVAPKPELAATAARAVSKPRRLPVSKYASTAKAAAAGNRARIDEGDSLVHPRRPLLPLALGVVVVIAAVWGGIRLFATNPDSQPASQVASAGPETSVDAPSAPPDAQGTLPSTDEPAAAGTHAGTKTPANTKQSLNAKPLGKAPHLAAARTTQAAAVNEVLPDVPQRARRTIRGNVKVSIRVIVEQDGTVFAALAEHRGPSRYFERLAIDAAKKWTFPPADSSAQRLMLVKFAFNRDGTTAEAVPL